MAIMREETFGPVIPIMAVADAAEAVRLANDTPYGLNASVWTRDVARGIEIARQIDSGAACVNECIVTAGCHDLPFGGVKQSGVGTRHGGAEGLRQFCATQSLLIERRRRKSEPAWFPYSARRARSLERLMGLLFR
jgi:betaine-aldehyde dehydrogenase